MCRGSWEQGEKRLVLGGGEDLMGPAGRETPARAALPWTNLCVDP